ncbi:hypothetical protein H206_06244 [Candidatus Electrothrix aarhusensis]|uniref:Uncharacterized protein n=1 Tax=Candidatus Electrothrix aarhusensis TaxID=1859131 RepID=A0A3S3RTF2_9BACT|nr:hypothetical protein H206_06244 [Candidatus Electrothrix aarhusensis]
MPFDEAQALVTHLYNLWKWFGCCCQNTSESCFHLKMFLNISCSVEVIHL